MKKLLMCAALALCSAPASGFEKGDWLLSAGVVNVDPKSDNHPVVNVDAGLGLGLTATYLFTQHWAIDILAAAPFNHDVNLNDGGARVGETDQLPPTVSLQYHFLTGENFKPYVGLGVNYTTFFDEDTQGVLGGSELELEDSWGLAAQVGFDYAINERWFIKGDVRWMDIDAEANIDNVSIGDVEIDPLVYGFSLGYRF